MTWHHTANQNTGWHPCQHTCFQQCTGVVAHLLNASLVQCSLAPLLDNTALLQEVYIPRQPEAVSAVGIRSRWGTLQALEVSRQVLTGPSSLLCSQHFPGV